VKLAFTPKLPFEIEVYPHKWKYKLKYYLRSRTFYSTRKLERMPTSLATKTDPLLRMREEKSRWEICRFGPSCWRKDDSPEEGESVLDKRLRPWTTTLALPVNASKDLLPTFFNALSARQYALVLHLIIKGLHHPPIELIVPVQAIYYPTNAPMRAIEADIENSGQDCNVPSMGSLSIQSMILHEGSGHDPLREQNFSLPPYDCL
jgi:hypothetical protein